MNLKLAIKKSLRRRVFYKYSKDFAAEENTICGNGIFPELSEAEKKEIATLISDICPYPAISYSGYRIYKKLYGFNAEFIPLAIFFPWMIRVLNPIDYATVYSNKSITDKLFSNIKQPKVILKRVGGEYIHDNYSLDITEAIKLLSEQHHDMIIKPSTDSCGGNDVTLLNRRIDSTNIKEVLNKYTSDFVVQERLPQSQYISQFNASSLNTFRITTLLLNGKFTVCMSMLRCGNAGSVVDNVAAGGCCVGVNDDGTLNPFGFSSRCEKIFSHNNMKFKDYNVPFFERIIDLCREAHHVIPNCHYIGWDVALDENNDAVLIEVNTIAPGTFFEQLANARCAFRNRFEEVIAFIKANQLPLSKQYDQCM